MAKVMVDGSEYEAIGLRIATVQDKTNIQLMDNRGNVSLVVIGTDRPLKVFVTGNVKDVKHSNINIIRGNVKKANVGNCLYVDGLVKDFESSWGSIVRKQENELGIPDMDKKLGSSKARIIRVVGDLVMLSINVLNLSCLSEIKGNVENFDCMNCAYVIGNIDFAYAGNRIYSTFGIKETVEHKKARVKQEKARKEKEESVMDEMQNMFSDLFDKR